MPTLPQAQKLEAARELDIPTTELDDYLEEMNGKIAATITDTEEARGQEVISYNLRKGMYARPWGHLPFAGAADIRFRLAEIQIRKYRPAFVMALYSSPLIVRVLPYQAREKSASATKLEHYYNFFFRVKDQRFIPTIAAAVSKFLTAGRCIVKITHELRREPVTATYPLEQIQQTITSLHMQSMQAQAQSGQEAKPLTDRQLKELTAMAYGWDADDPIYSKRLDDVLSQVRAKKEVITIVEDRIVRNQPVITNIARLSDVIFPTDTAWLADAEWIAHEMLFSERELRLAAKENGGKYDHVEDIIDAVSAARREPATTADINQARDYREGISIGAEQSRPIRVRELYCWLPRKLVRRMRGKVKGDEEVAVRSVLTYCPDVPGEDGVLRVMEFPYDHGTWPFELHCFNFDEERAYSGEGLPRLLESVSREFDITRNAAINRLFLTLSPPVLIWDKAGISPQAHRQVAQAHLTKVPPAQAMFVPEYPNLVAGMNLEAGALMQWADQIAGVPNIAGLGGYAVPPTAAQVDALVSPANAILQYELLMFHQFLSRIFKHVHELTKQYGFVFQKEKIEAPNLQTGEPVELTAEDFQGDYMLVPGFDVTRQNPVMEAQRDLMATQLGFQAPQFAPYIRTYDAARDTFSRLLGPMRAQVWLKTREEAGPAEQQFLQMQAQIQAQAAQGKKPRMTRLKDMPQAAQMGIAPKFAGN